MDNLPKYLISKIFEFVNISDLLNLRLVSKEFKSIVNYVQIDELIYEDFEATKEHYPLECNWYYTKKPLEKTFKIDYETLFEKDPYYNLIKSSFLNLINLKRLRIDYGITHGYEFLNDLKNLQHLELRSKHNFRSENQIYLPNLKIFCCSNQYNHLILNAPKLKIYLSSYYGLITIDLKHPNSIKHLNCYGLQIKLFKFKNLECLKLRSQDLTIYDEDDDESNYDDEYDEFEQNVVTHKTDYKLEDILKYLIKLKEFHIHCRNASKDTFKNELKQLIDNKIRLNRDLAIYLNGKKIETIDEQINNI